MRRATDLQSVARLFRKQRPRPVSHRNTFPRHIGLAPAVSALPARHHVLDLSVEEIQELDRVGKQRLVSVPHNRWVYGRARQPLATKYHHRRNARQLPVRPPKAAEPFPLLVPLAMAPLAKRGLPSRRDRWKGSDPKEGGSGRVKTRTAPRPYQAFGLGGSLPSAAQAATVRHRPVCAAKPQDLAEPADKLGQLVSGAHHRSAKMCIDPPGYDAHSQTVLRASATNGSTPP